MFLSIFIHFNYHFKTLTHSFYKASSHINIRTRNKIYAGVLIIRRGNNCTRGRGQPKVFEFFSSQCPKMCQKHPIPYFNTCITYLITLTRLHILIHSIPILKHSVGFRLSAPYLKTCITYLNTLTRLSALGSIS